MKKLLSAVTSLVMAATFVSSAFTSSLVVSAAGSVPAVQPNVSMGGVKDVTANKNASNADFIVDLVNPEDENGYWHANAGENVNVDAHIKTNTSGLTVAGFSFDITVEGGIKIAEIVKICPALNNTALVSDYNSGNVNGTSEGKDGDGLTVTDGNLFYYTFNVPEGTPDGLYELNFTKTELLKADKTRHNVSVQKGYIQVGDVKDTTTTTDA
ncbi:MAG: hypothetical protein J6B74_06355 [Ruminococcus sp.]|nr:hypothetical protein [Ruminococcus sp.]